MEDCAKPFVSSTEKVKDFQTSFAIVEPDKDNIVFSVKAFEYDYIFDYDKLN